MFAFIIEKYMLKKNISVEELSELTNMDKEYIIKLVNNEINNTDLNTLQKIAKVLNVNVKELFYCVDEYETLREKMHEIIKKIGIKDKRVNEISYILDLLHNVKMKNIFDKL